MMHVILVFQRKLQVLPDRSSAPPPLRWLPAAGGGGCSVEVVQAAPGFGLSPVAGAGEPSAEHVS
jgi:hypothetical protein